MRLLGSISYSTIIISSLFTSEKVVNKQLRILLLLVIEQRVTTSKQELAAENLKFIETNSTHRKMSLEWNI